MYKGQMLGGSWKLLVISVLRSAPGSCGNTAGFKHEPNTRQLSARAAGA